MCAIAGVLQFQTAVLGGAAPINRDADMFTMIPRLPSYGTMIT